jgi:hypothetical protein
MTRILIPSFLVLTILFLFSCKKNNDRDPISPFSAPGFWTGSLSAGVGIGIINREDGTTRLYILVSNADTATAPIKHDGTYTVSGGVYKAEYQNGDVNSHNTINLETSRTTAYSMTGVFVQDGVIGGNHSSSNYIFNVGKQQ